MGTDLFSPKHVSGVRKINLSPFARVCAVLCALVTAYAPTAGGQGGATEPPQAPILRIEAEMHTAKITRISTDAAGRYLATASEDKTVRIWELPGGRLLRVLRPPIGKGNEGKLHAVAMSPDAKTVACAGWTSLEWDGNFSVYFFDRASGRMLKRITGLPASINNLTYAPDGRVLVISLGGKKGVLFYRTTDDSLLAEDRDYGADSYGASFDAKGRLVTSSYDGFLRLYDVDFHLVTKAKLAEGARPYGVGFTPDGSKIAVGFENSSQVVIASGQDLKPLYAADTSGIKNVAFNAVAWSPNGQTLFAGGQYRVGEQHPIRKWDNQGQGKGIDLPAASNTIVHLLPVSPGSIAYAAADPALGVFDAQDHRTLYQGPPLADYRDGEPAFLISKDAATVQFPYERGGKAATRFSIADRLIRQATNAGGGLLPPKTTAAGLTFTSWKNSATVTVNGRSLPLEQYEVSRCLAITPDEQSFLLGTVWNLRLFDREGRQLWQVAAPANVWGVNIAGNGQVAVAAIADGTIRWYRMADGQELLALYAHPDRRRWTLWTPSGYYDAGPGAEALLGWHKNYRRATEADFFSIDRFRAVSYRPDVVARVLTTMDEQEALRLAQAPLTAQAAAPGRLPAEPTSPGSEGFTIKPMLYALVIGVSKYPDAGLSLPFASKDARDLAAALQRQEGSAFRGVKVTLLTDDQATKGKILDGLDWLDRETTSKDLAMIFLAGHGVADKNGLGYFLPIDGNIAQLRKTALPFADLKNTVTALAGQSVVLLDTCRPDDRLSASSCSGGITALADDLANSGRGAVVLTAAGRNQAVRDDPGRGNGAFAKALLNGLSGKSGGAPSEPVTMSMLAAQVTEEVRTFTTGGQTPLTLMPPAGHDFLVAGPPGALPAAQTRPAAALATASGPPDTQQSEILRRLPPVVTVLSPQDGAGISNTTVTVQYSVRSPSGEPITQVVVLVDGRPLPTQRGVSVVADTSTPQDVREVRVTVPDRDSVISLLARNRWAISDPATVRVSWQGVRGAARTAAKPNLYAVAIGVSKYADPTLSLGLAAKDAKDLAETLQRQRGKLYEQVMVKVLTDGQATKEGVLEALDWLDHQTTDKDVAMLFLAGHGINDKSGTYYFLPHNAKTDQLRRTALPFSDIRNTVAYLPGKALLFADTCHSGDILGTRRAVADINAVVNELASAENGAIVFASSTGKQYALENPAWGNGAFTKALVEGLTGKAAYGQGSAITVNMLDLYLSERVKALTNGEQTPTTAKPHTIQDFPVAVKLS